MLRPSFYILIHNIKNSGYIRSNSLIFIITIRTLLNIFEYIIQDADETINIFTEKNEEEPISNSQR